MCQCAHEAMICRAFLVCAHAGMVRSFTCSFARNARHLSGKLNCVRITNDRGYRSSTTKKTCRRVLPHFLIIAPPCLMHMDTRRSKEGISPAPLGYVCPMHVSLRLDIGNVSALCSRLRSRFSIHGQMFLRDDAGNTS